MSSPKRSPKQSPKKGRASPTKGSKMTGEELQEFERKYFSRKRYNTMDAVFTQKSPAISLYVRSIHLYEIWNRLPHFEQYCNSNEGDMNISNASPKASSKKSPKKGGTAIQKEDGEEIQKPEYEPAEITGVVAVQKNHIHLENKLFVEITAKFRYIGHAKVPPFPDNVASECQCFRDVKVVYPINFDLDYKLADFNQQLIFKLKKSFGKGYRFFPFTFDVTRKPDSLFFTRPFYPDYSSGLFWNLRAYIAHEENCNPLPNEEISMEFFKYTIAPVLSKLALREAPVVEYRRFSTTDDTGDLILTAQLEHDTYYQGQEIRVKIQIENNSSRHTVDTVAVFVEQTYRIFHQFPHDYSIPLGEVILKGGDSGLPIQPKSKYWSKEVQVKPVYDRTKYNLAVNGKMPVDNKIFLADSTIIMMSEKVYTMTTEQQEEKAASPKGSPTSKKKSPEDKTSPKNKKKGAPKTSPTAPVVEADEQHLPDDRQIESKMNEVNILTNKQACRSATIAYDVVVRLNLKTTMDDESGHPMVRLPFILTRETRYLDKLINPPPPTWAIVLPH